MKSWELISVLAALFTLTACSDDEMNRPDKNVTMSSCQGLGGIEGGLGDSEGIFEECKRRGFLKDDGTVSGATTEAEGD